MGLMHLPPEIIRLIIYHTIFDEYGEWSVWFYDNDDIIRALRLKLVCRQFYHAVEPALLKTDALSFFQSRGKGLDWVPDTLEDWRIRRMYGADHFWHRYHVHRSRAFKSHDHTEEHHGELRRLTLSICDETGAEFEPTLDTICWLGLEGAGTGVPSDGYSYFNPKTFWLNYHTKCYSVETDEPSLNLLSAAAYFNLVPLAKKLLQEGHASTENDLLEPAVALAALAGNVDMLNFLQENTPDFPERDDYVGIAEDRIRDWRYMARQMGIFGAATRGDLNLLQQLVSPAAVTDPESEHIWVKPDFLRRRINETCGPASLVAMSGRWTKSLEVWKHAESVWVTPMDDRTKQLEFAGVCWYGQIDIARHLIDNCGADIHGLGEMDDRQPLVVAARASHMDVVDLLLARGANPNEYSRSRRSPLDAAAAAGSLEIVRKLLKAGATDVDAAFVTAVKMEHDVMMDLLNEVGNVTADAKSAALGAAAMKGLESMVRKLWRRGVRLQQPLEPPSDLGDDEKWKIEGAEWMLGIVEREEGKMPAGPSLRSIWEAKKRDKCKEAVMWDEDEYEDHTI